MPKNTDEEKKVRNEMMQDGLKKAVNVPLSVMRISDSCWPYMKEMAKYGNISSSSDLAVSAKSLETGIWGALKNVEINLPQIEDKKYKDEVLKEGHDIMLRARTSLAEVEDILNSREK
jgi:glutamate formiminotransferase/formiminotetrahydrofolate cyclodeaminase